MFVGAPEVGDDASRKGRSLTICQTLPTVELTRGGSRSNTFILLIGGPHLKSIRSAWSLLGSKGGAACFLSKVKCLVREPPAYFLPPSCQTSRKIFRMDKQRASSPVPSPEPLAQLRETAKHTAVLLEGLIEQGQGCQKR
ncbi:hypothetical protein CEXT_749991 [Caerostris extrusa]|uniref:Uncharacterized protein n=1 Tax=Caerostris extrusa TaxID=172846 RepID=A0AAV4XFW7_CAEEX|nr:hypothetical protein CEXT_749991 [Caerostris extrusa]